MRDLTKNQIAFTLTELGICTYGPTDYECTPEYVAERIVQDLEKLLEAQEGFVEGSVEEVGEEQLQIDLRGSVPVTNLPLGGNLENADSEDRLS